MFGGVVGVRYASGRYTALYEYMVRVIFRSFTKKMEIIPYNFTISKYEYQIQMVVGNAIGVSHYGTRKGC